MGEWVAEHVLTLLIVTPIVGAVLVALLPAAAEASIRRVSLSIATATLLLAILASVRFLQQQPLFGVAGDTALHERADWLVWPDYTDEQIESGARPWLRLQYAVAVDGISLPLILLTALLTPLAILASFSGIRQRVKEYYALLLLLHGAMLGVFCARDLLLFYVFFEFTLVPLYFVIAIWGGAERRRAANMFFIYTLAGSVFTFAGVLYLGWMSFTHAPTGEAMVSFDMDRLYLLAADGVLTPAMQGWLFLAFFAGFAIKVPIFPLHTWLPLAHTEAPTAGSAILAGVLLKLGTYGFLRISLPMLPEASLSFAPWIAWLAIVGIIYGALAAWVQRDVKKLVAYSSVSHLGFCMLGMFSMKMAGLTGALLYMVNHGLSTAALFFVVGMIYERYHTRRVDELGGLARKMPVMTFFLIVFTLASVGLPGLNGFISEFLVLLGTFTSDQATPDGPAGSLGITYAAFAATGIILSAVYLLFMCRAVLFGPEKEPAHGFDRHSGLTQDLTRNEVAVLAPIAVLCLVLGVAPKPLIEMMQPALKQQTLSRLSAAALVRESPAPDALLASLSPVANAGQGTGPRRLGAEQRDDEAFDAAVPDSRRITIQDALPRGDGKDTRSTPRGNDGELLHPRPSEGAPR